MPRNNETTTKFKVDISELKSAMQEARKQVAYANSEFKAVSSSLDDWSKSSDGLNAKLKQLKSNLDSQEKVLKEYENTLEEVKKEYGENSKEALEYATKLNNQQAVINKIKKEMAGYEDALEEVSKAEKIAAKTGKDVAEVLDDVGNEAEDAGDGFTVFKGAVATFVGNGLTALVGGLRDAATSLLGLSESTREYREDLNKLQTAFTTAGFTTEQATDVYKEFFAVLGEEDRSVEAVNHLAQLVDTEKDLETWTDICTGVWATFGDSLPIEGLTEAANETAKTGKLTGVLADSLNWAGESEDEFQAKLDSLNSEQERAAFITETLNGLYSDTADEYRKNNASILEANKAQSDYADAMARMGAIIEPVTTTLKAGFAELLNTALTLFGGEVNIEAFTSKLQEGFGVLTNSVLPAVKDGLGWILENKDAIISGLAGIATGFVAFNVASIIMSVVEAFKAFKLANEGATVAQWLLNAAMNANPIMLIVTLVAAVVGALITFIATNDEARAKIGKVWDSIKEKIASFVESIKVFFTETIPQFFQSLIDWVKTNWQAILLFLINPFAGLFKYFYDNNSKFREFIDSMVNVVKNAMTTAKDWIADKINAIGKFFTETIPEFFQSLIDWIKINWESILLYFINPFAGLFKYFYDNNSKFREFVDNAIAQIKQLPEKAWTWLQNTIAKVTTWFTQMSNKARETGSSFVNKLIEFISQLPSKVLSYLSNVISNVSSFASSLASKASEAGRGFVNNLVNAVSGVVSKMQSIGSDIVNGIWSGISSGWGWLKDKVSNLAGSLFEAAKEALDINSPSKVFADEVGKWIPAGIAVGIDKNAKTALNSVKNLALDTVGSARAGLNTATTTLGGSSTGGAGGVVNNFTQVINSPKQLSRLDIYRQSKNLLGYAGGGM